MRVPYEDEDWRAGDILGDAFLDTRSDMMCLLHETLAYNVGENVEPGNARDIMHRIQIYERLASLKNTWSGEHEAKDFETWEMLTLK